MTCGAAPTNAPPKKCRTARGGSLGGGRSTKLPQSGSHSCCAGCAGCGGGGGGGCGSCCGGALASTVMRGRQRPGATWRNRGGAQHSTAASNISCRSRALVGRRGDLRDVKTGGQTTPTSLSATSCRTPAAHSMLFLSMPPNKHSSTSSQFASRSDPTFRSLNPRGWPPPLSYSTPCSAGRRG